MRIYLDRSQLYCTVIDYVANKRQFLNSNITLTSHNASLLFVTLLQHFNGRYMGKKRSCPMSTGTVTDLSNGQYRANTIYFCQ